MAQQAVDEKWKKSKKLSEFVQTKNALKGDSKKGRKDRSL